MTGSARLDAPTLRTIAALGVTQIVGYGTLFYGMMLLGPRIMAETGWSSAFVYGGFTLALVVAGSAATPVGKAIDRQGGRSVMTVGAIIGGLGFLLLALAHEGWLYLAAFALIGLSMAAALYDAAFATLARVAGPNARRAISALTLAGGLASTVFWPVSYWLLGLMDWRMVALVYAGLLGLGCAALHAFALPSRNWAAPTSAGGAPAPPPEPPPLASPDLRSWLLVAMGLAITFHGAITNALSVHLSPTLDALGLSEGEAILAASLIGPSQSAARLIELMLSGRYPILALGLVSTGLMPLAFLILIGGAFGLKAVIAFAVVYGASNGLLTIARGVIPLALFGRVGYGRTLGLIGGPALIAKAAAPLVFAALLTGFGPAASMLILAALSILAFLGMVAIVVLVRRSDRPS